MTRLILHGALGRMGRQVTALAQSRDDIELVRVDRSGLEGCAARLEDVEPGGVIVDFSNHAATLDVLNYAIANSLPVVLATTGHTGAELTAIQAAASRIPVFKASNLSVGVAVLTQLVKLAAAAFPQADVEIVETHHNRKQDAPSGTALSLAQAVQQARGGEIVLGRQGQLPHKPGEIGVHALRLGNVPGTHEVYLDTGTQTITLTHQAQNRAIFAEGALDAARFIRSQRPGLYAMPDLLAGMREEA